MIDIQIHNSQDDLPLDEARLREAVTRVLSDADIEQAEVSLAIVDDATIHELNRQWLAHDEPTDVLSFVLEREAGRLEGEIIASSQTALAQAAHYGWPAEHELLLYVVHGALHLVGHDDTDPPAAEVMRRREREVLAAFGLVPPWRATRALEPHTEEGTTVT